ncbi:hypothetical protein GCM10010517_10790 [Streptosporangium fragile]|uniref:Uncharacterized protein n=1 Tax=Streptosporangium fragile TaxID=46186 RepID=A0ABN3VSM7_9ACTN
MPVKRREPAGSPPKEPRGGTKASSAVKLAVLGAISLVVATGCAESDDDLPETHADCVEADSRAEDGSYRIVDDSYCVREDSGETFSHGSYQAYHWYYSGVYVGDRVSLGSTVRPSDVNISSRGGTVIQRGGFGGRGSSGG